VAEQNPVPMECALWLPGRAGGVDDDRRIIGLRIDRVRRFLRDLPSQGPKIISAMVAPSAQETVVSSGKLPWIFSSFAAPALSVMTALAPESQPVGQRFFAKEREQGDRNPAEFQGCDVSKGCFRASAASETPIRSPC
jgi:hypothetical protein